MNNLNLNKYLNIVNEEKVKKGLTTYIPLYPMFRVEKDKLYIVVLLTSEKDNVWDFEGKVKGEYWVLIDPFNDNIVEFNKTSEKDFVIGTISEKNIIAKQKEISKYIVGKSCQYENYLINDIKSDKLPLQKELADILGNKLDLDGKTIELEDYLFSNLENDIKTKIKELIDVLLWSKYGSITFYYDILFKLIVDEYKNKKAINKDKIKYCIRIMDYYYDGVIGISNLFNL